MTQNSVAILIGLKINAKGDISPAKILGKHFATEGDDVEFTCSSFGYKTGDGILYIYLCKNGVGTKLQIQRDRFDTKFQISSVKIEDSGNYSCVSTKTEYKPSDVKAKKDSSIFLQVSAGVLPADIALKEMSVMEGRDVEFTCTISDLWRAGSRDAFYIHLYKDGAIVQIKVWDTRNREAIFIVRNVRVGDSGRYSCVVMSPKLISRNMTRLQANNSVDLQVHEKEAKGIAQEVMVGLVILLLISLILLGLWSYRLHLKQAACKKCTESEVSDDLNAYDEIGERRGQREEVNQRVCDNEVWDDMDGYTDAEECRGMQSFTSQRAQQSDPECGYAQIQKTP